MPGFTDLSDIRVVICGMPRLLGEIVNQIVTARPSIQIVGEPTKWQELVEVITRGKTDVVVVGCEEDELMTIGSRLLGEHPLLKILAITNDGRKAALYELWPRLRELPEPSPDILLDAIEEVPNWIQGD